MWAQKDFLVTYEAIQKTIRLATKFAEKQAILLIPGNKRDDLSYVKCTTGTQIVQTHNAIKYT